MPEAESVHGTAGNFAESLRKRRIQANPWDGHVLATSTSEYNKTVDSDRFVGMSRVCAGKRMQPIDVCSFNSLKELCRPRSGLVHPGTTLAV